MQAAYSFITLKFMAKSARSTGAKGKTHYNPTGKPIARGRTAGTREEGNGEEANNKDEEKRPYARKPLDAKSTTFRSRNSNSSESAGREEKPRTRKPYSSDSTRPEKREGDTRPYSDKSPRVSRSTDDQPNGERRSYGSRGGDSEGYTDNKRKSFPKRENGPSDRPSNREDRDKKPFTARKDQENGDRPFKRDDRDKKPFAARRDQEGGDRPFKREDRDKKPFSPRKENGDRPNDRPFRKTDDQRPAPAARKRFEEGDDTRNRDNKSDGEFKRPFSKRPDSDRGASDRKPRKTFGKESRESSNRGAAPNREGRSSGAFSKRGPKDNTPYKRKAFSNKYQPDSNHFESEEFSENSNPAKPGKWDTEVKTGPMTLNKYLAHSGISSRRDAAILIKEGKVELNGKVFTEPGYRVQPEDVITIDKKVMVPQRNFVYVLLNKPKDFLTTTEDDRGRRTVMELVSGASEDRLYPIGRLDRNTTGVLLMTNDGDLAQKLSHPKYENKKIYQVSLDKDLTKKDFDKIVEGVVLEDGLAKVDRLAYLDDKNEIGLEIHSGRNRIVRRIFESLGYDVVRLDRVMYAGLTKKNVSRGKWRFLTEKEIINLKHFRSY